MRNAIRYMSDAELSDHYAPNPPPYGKDRLIRARELMAQIDDLRVLCEGDEAVHAKAADMIEAALLFLGIED